MTLRLIAQETVKLIRKSANTTYDASGFPIAPANDPEVDVECNIQSVEGRDVIDGQQVFQDIIGDREVEMVAVYSETKFQLKDRIKRFPGTADEKIYEVLFNQNWNEYPAMRETRHYRCIMGKVEAQ